MLSMQHFTNYSMDYKRYLRIQWRLEWFYDFHPDFFDNIPPEQKKLLQETFLYDTPDEGYPESLRNFTMRKSVITRLCTKKCFQRLTYCIERQAWAAFLTTMIQMIYNIGTTPNEILYACEDTTRLPRRHKPRCWLWFQYSMDGAEKRGCNINYVYHKLDFT